MSWTEALVRSPPRLRPAPHEFSGQFSTFFETYVIPNLPSAERAAAFDELLKAHFNRPSPCYVVRKVAEMDRRSAHINDHQLRILPSDNSPGWYVHALLMSELPLPRSPENFFEIIPRHFHDARLRADLSKAGFHLAHLTNANNRDTNWQTWERPEVERRMMLSIHPWNWSLLAKTQWRTHGGRPDILAFIDRAYAEHYGSKYAAWRLKFPIKACGERDPHYGYFSETRDQRSRAPSAVRGAIRKIDQRYESDSAKPLNRPMIRRDWSDRGINLHLTLAEGQFVVPHDALMRWAIETKNVGQTESWRRGLYSWPRPTADMLAFLRDYRKA